MYVWSEEIRMALVSAAWLVSFSHEQASRCDCLRMVFAGYSLTSTLVSM